jgi:MraZ protein
VFLGRFEHNLDVKGRLAIPARFRAELEHGLVVTRGIDRCLAVYPIEAWRDLADRIHALPVSDVNARQFRRMVFSEASDLSLDTQGRIVLSANLRAYAGIERETIVIGLDRTFEIWSPERWAEVNDSVELEGASIAARLGELL